MNLSHIEPQSFIYGPGSRFVIWVQGCSIHCKGCWNFEMWNFEPKILLSVEEILKEILEQKESIEGITILGGEPLDQYEETLKLFQLCKQHNLTTMLFSGYEMQSVKQKMANILNFCDIFIDGKYQRNKRTINHEWIGSTNQQIYFLTDKYKNYEIKNANYVEIDIEENGKITIMGFPST